MNKVAQLYKVEIVKNEKQLQNLSYVFIIPLYLIKFCKIS